MFSKDDTAIKIVDVDDVLAQWRTRATTIIMYIAVVVALPTVIVTLLNMSRMKSWTLVIILCTLYLLLIVLAVFKRIDYRLRGLTLLFAGYVMAITNMATTGLEGSGRVYLMALPILGVILIGIRTGWITTAISALIFGAFCLFSYYGISQTWIAPAEYTAGIMWWINVGLTMMLLLLVIITLLVRMYRFLINSLRAERKLSAELEKTYDATLEGWANALELRDIETAGHCHRVSEITQRLANEFAAETIDRIDIHRGSLLHDIGKMGIPDSILLKPGKLTADEFKLIQEHTIYAFELLSHIPYLTRALDIPYCHHEKWDGTGYPRGLKGTDIPLAARIFSIVDVYDALTSDRPYRPAWSEEKALTYVTERSGIDFDPDVVEAFIKLAREEADFFAEP